MIVKKRVRYTVGPSGSGTRPKWRLTGGDAVRGMFPTQKAAIAAAVTICRSRLRNFGSLSELFIKGRNGKIRDSRTYGRDPRDVKG